ncbi:lytic transglycosylase domain-containing protein [Rahnella inusitata]|uniref:lytic transglycosylase domain-containing protein n=1 Tax=Rahnella inusitata TaxID=58169 RepID=UPI0039BDD67E
MMKSAIVILLLATGGQCQAASDAELLYASLYGEPAQPQTAITPVSFNSDRPHADSDVSPEWTQAMQSSWGKTRSLSELATIQKEVVAEIKEVVNNPVVNGVRRNVPEDIGVIIKKYAEKYNISEVLVKALIQQESSFNPRAVSKVGAKGLMQLMPVHTDKQGIDPFDPEQNIKTGMGFLSHLLNKYGDLRLALAAYNAGEKAVDKYGDVPPYKETQDYVNRIMAMLGG